MAINTIAPVQTIKNAFLGFLQQYYGGLEATNEFYWNQNVRTTKMMITDRNVINSGEIQKMPAIVGARGPITLSDKALGQVLEHNYFDTTHTFLGIYQGGIRFNCQSINGIQAERLATSTFNLFLTYGLEWAKYIENLHHFGPVTIGEEEVVKPTSGPAIDVVQVPIFLNVLIEHSWSITTLGEELKEIDIESIIVD
jgi:hypothetical protein